MSVHAQRQLILKKRGKEIAVFRQGDKLRFKLKEEKYYHNKMIADFYGGKINFNYFDLHPDEIETLYVWSPKKNVANVISAIGIQGGVFFMAIDVLNQGFVKGDGFEPSQQTLMIGGALVGTGLLAKLLVKHKYKIDGIKYTLELR